jgi:CheY-like chemotaxis protein
MTGSDYGDCPLLLLAEDDDGHARLLQEYLKEAGLPGGVHRLRDGLETMAYLAAERERRRLVLLLDIRMPGLSGPEVLSRIRADARLKLLTVIMLTTTDDDREVEACYRAGCNAYFVKPFSPDGFRGLCAAIAAVVRNMRVPAI